MLIDLTIGDAYGAAFEYVDRAIVEKNNNLEYHQHPTHLATKPGMYTDDTQRLCHNSIILTLCIDA